MQAPPSRRPTEPAGHAGLPWNEKENPVLHYAVVFLIIALVAALFGFGGIAAGAASIAQTLFFVFIVLAVIGFAVGLLRGGR